VHGLGLVGVQPLDAQPLERLKHLRMELLGRVGEPRSPTSFARLADKPAVRPAGVEQLGPRLDRALLDHGLR
jgi:hypothetical protein